MARIHHEGGQRQARALTLKGDAEAHVIAARATALGDNPALVSYTEAERWNGQLPATVPGGQMGTPPVFDMARAARQ